MRQKVKSAGKALSLRAKFKDDSTVEVVVLEAISQTTFVFRIPLNWNSKDTSLPVPIKQESDAEETSDEQDSDAEETSDDED